MGRLKSLPPWPNPQESIGQQIISSRVGNRQVWLPRGPAVEIFDNVILREVENNLKAVDPGHAELFLRLYMIGRKPESANPIIMICCTNNKVRDAAEAAIRETGLLDTHRGFGLGTVALPLEQPAPIRRLSPKNKGRSFSMGSSTSNSAIESAGFVPPSTGNTPPHPRPSLVEHLPGRFSSIDDSSPFIINALPRVAGFDESHLNTIVFASCSEPSLGRRIFTSTDISQAPHHYATAGVIIRTGEHFYQLTAGHLFEPESVEFDVESVSMCLDECHFDGQSDDEECDSNHESEVTGRGSATPEDALSCDGSSSNSTSEEVASENSLNVHRDAHPKLHRNLNRQGGLSGLLPTEGKQKAVSRSSESLTDPTDSGVPIGSIPQGRMFRSSIDYAIITLHNDSVQKLGRGINRIPRPHSKNIRNVAEVGHNNRGIIVVTYTTLIEGILIPGKVSHKSHRSHQFERLVQIELERGAHEGDCGSPVLDRLTGNLYGHIIMGVPGSKVAYIIQALDIFKDIEAAIGEPVSIATMEDIKKMNPPTSTSRIQLSQQNSSLPSPTGAQFIGMRTSRSQTPAKSAASMFTYPPLLSMSTATTPPDTFSVALPSGGLPCEFVGYHHCDAYFSLDDVDGWIVHIISEHLDNHLPDKLICWFCDNFVFDYKDTGDRRHNFERRMWHIRNHIVEEGLTVHHMRPDHYLNEHLRDHRLIPEDTCHLVRRRTELSQPGWIYPHDSLSLEPERMQSLEMAQYNRRKHRHKGGKSQK